ncbi:hypothetical protein T02_4164 [Trichinella nativa]|uniref:Uncharacterized protein n=1 Tax=Trichinella nativa TaxID=6335 RepID=A0A0V1LST7_9BILA|nr:hypothetical protein T02_4164 [Trichinella nativa]
MSFCQCMDNASLTWNTIEGLVSQVSVRRLSSSLSLRVDLLLKMLKRFLSAWLGTGQRRDRKKRIHFTQICVHKCQLASFPNASDSQSWRGRRPTPAVSYLLRRPVLPPLLRPFAAFFPRSHRPRQPPPPPPVDNSMSIERRRKASPIIGQRCGQRRPPLVICDASPLQKTLAPSFTPPPFRLRGNNNDQA